MPLGLCFNILKYQYLNVLDAVCLGWWFANRRGLVGTLPAHQNNKNYFDQDRLHNREGIYRVRIEFQLPFLVSFRKLNRAEKIFTILLEFKLILSAISRQHLRFQEPSFKSH